MENSSSPLKKYSRKPKLYIDLPSKGYWYSKDALTKTEELEVYSMTANDEISTKTPDALITGNTIVSIIQSCIPDIKNAWAVTNRDLDYILAAIRIASYGDTMTVNHTCTSCNNEDSFALPLQNLLDHLASANLVYEAKLNGFTFRLRPLTYKEIVESQQHSMRVRRQIIQLQETVKDLDARTTKLNELYEEINNFTKELIARVVVEVVTPDGDIEKTPAFIKDFILNDSEGDYFNEIQKIYINNNNLIQIPASEIECSGCGKKEKVAPGLDYTSFFSRQ